MTTDAEREEFIRLLTGKQPTGVARIRFRDPNHIALADQVAAVLRDSVLPMSGTEIAEALGNPPRTYSIGPQHHICSDCTHERFITRRFGGTDAYLILATMERHGLVEKWKVPGFRPVYWRWIEEVL